MKRPMLTALGIALLAACAEGPAAPTNPDSGFPVRPGIPDDVLLSTGSARRADAERRSVTRAEVQSFAGPERSVGSSLLIRGPDGVRLQLHATGIDPDAATTLWVVVFNNPEACVGECDDPDLFDNPATQADLMYAAGDVANASGRVTYHADIAERDGLRSIMPLFGMPAPGIIDAGRAEIHVVIRDHGPRLPLLADAQTTTFNGGCDGMGPEFGAPGPNRCTEPYFASHYAPR